MYALPGQFTFEQVQHQISQRLKVIPPTLFVTQMRGNTGISCSTDKWLTAFDFDVFPSFIIPEPFGESKINDIDSFDFLSFANHEIVGFDVSVHKSFTMYLLQSSDDLNANINCGG